MAKMSCFSFLLGGNKKRSKVIRSKVAYAKKAPGNDCPPKVMPVEFMDMADIVDVNQGSGVHAPARDANASVCTVTAAESARQERDADQDEASTNRDSFDVSGEDSSSGYTSGDNNSKNAAETGSSVGRMSPPASPELKRSCSNIETARSVPVPEEFDLPAKSRSYGDLKALPSGRPLMTNTPSGGASPAAWSVRTSCSADRVMLKKRSASQVLPSRSRKLWWRLFLWSHRNLHRPAAESSAAPARPSADTHGGAAHRNDGYTSDTLDAVTTAREPKNKEVAVEEDPILPNHQWVAFSSEATSSLDRVSEWVNSLGNGPSFHVVEEEEEEDVAEHDNNGSAVRAAWCSEIVECSTAAAEKQHARGKRRAAEEAVQASSIVRTLNVVSSVAHISGMGLKAVPMIAAFSSLRSVNLSANLLVHIHPGSLPKGLRSLDLSRNKIASIEGLRELTRLRVLNLSYNRIARIGHGLSSCTAIRELYIAGNKISDVDGLHRLLKLAVLDVSFNKITTAKSLGQLVANYASLRALNLVGNPVQANVGDDTLRKAVAGLLPRVEYLNKQAVKPQRAREVAKDSVAQAALGNGGGWGARSRRTARRVSHQSPGSSGKGKSRGRGSRSRSKTSRAQGSSLARR